jgi:hypothetical protein
MTNDDIIRLALEHTINGLKFNEDGLLRFAKLVAQHEREACAKLEIELILSPAFFATMGEYDAHKDAVLAYRNLIRARGQA